MSALLLAVAVIAVTALGATFARAVVVSDGEVGGFEDDGDLVSGSGSDWDDFSPAIVTDDTRDSGFQGSSKEEDPGDWVCNSGGDDPGKGDILRAYVNPRISSKTSAFLDLGWVRDEGNGDAHVNFEFNQFASATPPDSGPCPIARAVGDFMVTYDFGGGDDAANIRAWRWDGLHWDEIAMASDAAAAANNSAVIADDPMVGGVQSIGVREFGEVSLDLTADGLPDELIQCPGYGYVNVRTRSSGESITSALQDRMPTTQVNLSSCASITVEKVDDLGKGLAGATFGLYHDDGDGSYDAGDTALDTCITALGPAGVNAPATCTFSNLEPSPPAYFVRELAAPAGYDKDPYVAKVEPGFRENVVVAHRFVDPLKVGSIKIVKKDALGNLVDGVRFVASQGGAPAVDRQGDPAECVTGSGSNSKGTCVIADLVPGSYVVAEDSSTLPDTMTAAPDQTVVVVGNEQVTVEFVNPLKPISIALTKLVNGSESVTVHEGDPLHYEITVTNTGDLPLTISALTDVANGDPVDLPGSCDTRVGSTIAVGAHFVCEYTVAAGSADVANTAAVTGEDSLGREVDADDTALVDVVHPGISLTKSVNGAKSYTGHAGDALTYSLSITNTGDTSLTITGLTDDANGEAVALPSGCTGLVGDTLAAGASTSCSYSATAGHDDIDNTAAVTAEDPHGGEVGDDDVAHVDVVHPAIGLTKLVNGHSSVTTHVGDPLEYTVRVENTGDVALTVTSLADAANGSAVTLPGACTANVGTTLDPGDSFLCTYDAVAGADVTNTASVTGTDGLPGGNVSASDTASVDVIHPSIDIEKTVNGGEHATVHAGDGLTYGLTITNTGDVQLDVTALTDVAGGEAVALPSSCTAAVGAALAPGASMSCSYGAVAPVDDISNTAAVAAVDPLQLAVSDDDVASVDVVHPSIDIEKLVNGADAVTVHEGDALTYSLAIRNTGDIALTLTALADAANGSAVSLPAGCTGLVGDSLAVGATTSCSYSATASDDVVNVASVSGADGLPGGSVSDDDGAAVDVVHPAILLEKLVNGQPAVRVHQGDPLSYSIKVTNVGDNTLTIGGLTDVASGNAVDLPADCDNRVGSTLAAGASFTCAYSATAPGTDVENVATVAATDGLPGGDVTSSDTALVDVISPDIAIEKLVNGATAVRVHEGDALTYSLRITNTGDAPLEITSLDDVAGGTSVSLPAGCTSIVGQTVHIGDSVQCAYTATATEDDVVNTASVTGEDELGGEVDDEDSASVDVIHPAITVEKSGEAQAHEGDEVTYTFVVTNHGDVTLEDIEVDDDVLGSIGTIDSLDPGESATLTKDFTVPEGDDNIVNVVEACGTDPLGLVVCDTDDHLLDPLHPDIEVVKTGPAQAHEGDIVLYSFTVTNVGDVDLTAVEVVDDVIGPIGTISSLEVDESVVLTVTFTVPVGSADIINVVEACGTDPLDLEVCDTDDHTLDPVHPAIDIVKTADPTSFSGGSATITYTYVVTNTGDVVLNNVTVDDDKLGRIGTVDSLDPGESATLTKTAVLTSATVNVGTAAGTDPLGKTVTDTDDANVDAVLGQIFERPRALPRTGAALLARVAMGFLLLAAGGLLLAAAERRRRTT